MIPTEKERVQHIIKAISHILDFVEQIDEVNFHKNYQLNSAVLFQFLIIGEAIIYVDNDRLEKYPYPWHLVRGFRNYIAHEYFGINMNLVWQTIIVDLPGLKRLLEEIYEKEF